MRITNKLIAATKSMLLSPYILEQKLIVVNFGLESLNKSFCSGIFKVPWLIAFHFYGNVNPELIEIDKCKNVFSKLHLQVLSFLSVFMNPKKDVYFLEKNILLELTAK